MATRQPVVTTIGEMIKVVTWTGLVNGDDGAPVDYPEFSDRTVQFRGTFGVGGSIQLEGSNQDAPSVTADYDLLADPQGSDIVKTAADLESVMDVPRWTRPRVTAGDGTTNLNVKMVMRRGTR